MMDNGSRNSPTRETDNVNESNRCIVNAGNNSSLRESPTTARRRISAEGGKISEACFALNTFGSKKAKIILPDGFEPNEFTVILGRGRSAAANETVEGNERLQRMVENSLKEYLDAPDKLGKSLIVTRVLETIRKASPHQAGFVKYEKGRWVDVGVRAAREKIGSLFRDYLGGKYKAGAKNKAAIRDQKKLSVNTGKQSESMRYSPTLDSPLSSCTDSGRATSHSASIAFHSHPLGRNSGTAAGASTGSLGIDDISLEQRQRLQLQHLQQEQEQFQREQERAGRSSLMASQVSGTSATSIPSSSFLMYSQQQSRLNQASVPMSSAAMPSSVSTFTTPLQATTVSSSSSNWMPQTVPFVSAMSSASSSMMPSAPTGALSMAELVQQQQQIVSDQEELQRLQQQNFIRQQQIQREMLHSQGVSQHTLPQPELPTENGDDLFVLWQRTNPQFWSSRRDRP